MRFALRFGLAHPVLGLELLLRRIDQEQAFASVLRGALPSLRARYERARSRGATSLRSSPESLQRTLERVVGFSLDRPPMAVNPWTAFLYLATRELRPRVIVETGVWYGWSSAAMLQGLHDNGSGKLVSVDLPPTDHKAQWQDGHEVECGLFSRSDSVGSSVPPELKDRWELRLGDALQVLPEILAREAPVSMFVHDSLHTYDHMRAEYTLAFPALADGGLLVSDDVGMNTAWEEFGRAHDAPGVRLFKGRHGDRPFAFAMKGGGTTRAAGGPP